MLLQGLAQCYIPDFSMHRVSCIESHVAYCKKTVNFGCVIGDDSVIIAVPLSSGAFHSDSC